MDSVQSSGLHISGTPLQAKREMLYDDARKAATEMPGDAHRQAALDIEQAITELGDPATNPALGWSIITL